jgi:oligoendopeptidase F
MPKLFSRLPKRPPRRYVPERLDCADVDELKRLHEQLLARPLPTLSAVKRWLEDCQELAVAVGEHQAMSYIRKSVNTRDKKAQADYRHIIQQVSPALAPYHDKLNRRLLEHPLRRKFPKRWSLMLRWRQNAVDLFREKNIPLQRQIEETALRYAQLMGGLEVRFEGRKQTLVQMGRYLDRPDRDLRRRAWETVARRRYQLRERLERIYDRLVALRHRVARNAGFPNFRDYCHQKYDRFDYTPRDCFVFHEGVEEAVLPAVRRLRARRAAEMGVGKLKPWDLTVDPLGRPPLQPFRDGARLAAMARRVFAGVDPGLGRQFGLLIRHGVLDLDNRPGKEPGGYQCTLAERRLPFIFMNAVGRDGDLRTLLHEGGHAFHMLAAREEPLLDYRHAPVEFCEVASMGMELLANRRLEPIYPRPAERERSTRMLLEGTLELLPWIATIDAFQHWVYTHPGHSRAERRAAWMKLRRRFDDGTDWSEHRRYEQVLWHRQLHLFHHPFYYIEYGIAQLGALMLWRRALSNPRPALAAYKRALALGGSVGLRGLFRAAGGRLDFSARAILPLVDAVMQRLGC